jgi:hypothetical protein
VLVVSTPKSKSPVLVTFTASKHSTNPAPTFAQVARHVSQPLESSIDDEEVLSCFDDDSMMIR